MTSLLSNNFWKYHCPRGGRDRHDRTQSETLKTLKQDKPLLTKLQLQTRSPSDNVFSSLPPVSDLSPPNPQSQSPHQNHFRNAVPLSRSPARKRSRIHHAPSKSSNRKPSLPGELAEPDPELSLLQPITSPHGIPKPSPRRPHQSPLRDPRHDLAAQHVRRLDRVAALVRHEAAIRVLGPVARQEREAEQAGCQPLQPLP